MYLYLLFLFLVVLFLILFKMNIHVLEPPMVFLLAWVFSSGYLCLGLFDYDIALVPATFFSILFSNLAFITGALIRRGIIRHGIRLPHFKSSYHEISDRSFLSPLNCYILVCGSLIYLFFQFYEAANVISSKGLSDISLFSLRAEKFVKYDIGIRTWVSLPKSLGRPCCIMLAISIAYFFRFKKIRLLLFAVFCWLGIVLESILVAGRFLIFFLLMGSGYFYLLMGMLFDKRVYNVTGIFNIVVKILKKLLTRKLGAVALLFLIFLYGIFVYWPMKLNPNLVNNVDFYLRLKHDIKINGWVKDISETPGFEWVKYFAYSTSYVGLPIVKYTFFSENSQIGDWNYYGLYNFPVFQKVASLISSERSSWNNIRDRIADICTNFGYTTNPWATGIRDFVIDFGYYGTIVILFFLGYLSQGVYIKMVSFPSFERLVMSSFVGVCSFIFCFLSPFVMGPILNSLLFSFLLLLIRRTSINYA